MSRFICSTHATKRSLSRGTPRVSTSTPTPWRTRASASFRTWRARPPSITGGYSHERISARGLIPETLYPSDGTSAAGALVGSSDADQTQLVDAPRGIRRACVGTREVDDTCLREPVECPLERCLLRLQLGGEPCPRPRLRVPVAEQKQHDRAFEPLVSVTLPLSE